MKVVFIIPRYVSFWEPLSVAYISSYIKHNYSGKLDVKFFHDNFDNFVEIVKAASEANIVGISCTTTTYKRAVEIAETIKLVSNPRIVLGGWHPTTMHAAKAIHGIDHVFDQVVVGEGEGAFLSVLNGKKDHIVFGEKLNFYDLYWPDREIIKESRHLDYCEHNWNERIASFSSRRGCSHSCTMCGEYAMSHNLVRIRNNTDLLDEIDVVNKQYNITKLKFLDPTFAYPKEATIDFCKEKIKRKNQLPWECMGHGAYLDEEVLKLMKIANCYQVNIGCESGDPNILKEIKKGITIKKIKEVFKIGHDVGLDMRAFFMVGFVNETQESFEMTKQLVRDIKPNVVGCTILTPFPGSLYYDNNKYKDLDWSGCNEYSNDFWETENFTNTELKMMQKEFNREFKDILVEHQRNQNE